LLIAHISDFHIIPAPALCYGFSDTRAGLAQAVATLNVLTPSPDLVLATGDLVDEPGTAAYATLQEILAALEIPFVLIPGNHDDRRLLNAAFPDQRHLAGSEGAGHFTLDLGEVRLVGFDVVVPGKEYADPAPAALDWLEDTLHAAPDMPTMIAMHHPPITTGLAFMDAIQPPWPPRLAAILDRHRQVKLVACGHVHRLIDGMIGGARIASAGSTGHQFVFATDLDSTPQLSGEPALIRLHLWQGGAVTSFGVPVAQDYPRHGFAGMDDAAWERIRGQLLAGQSRPAGATIEEPDE
jgi:3',5'-cyclic AMP phosphodiesterase CpdA